MYGEHASQYRSAHSTGITADASCFCHKLYPTVSLSDFSPLVGKPLANSLHIRFHAFGSVESNGESLLAP